jgi:hypothetical protein
MTLLTVAFTTVALVCSMFPCPDYRPRRNRSTPIATTMMTPVSIS